jgi:hypothetical protein
VNPYIGLLCFNIIYPLIFKIKSQHVDSDIKAYLSPKKKNKTVLFYLPFCSFYLWLKSNLNCSYLTVTLLNYPPPIDKC